MSGQISAYLRVLVAFSGVFAAGCSGGSAPTAPTGSPAGPPALVAERSASVRAEPGPGWGPETPYFNLEVILRGEDGGFGHVKFRQPNDDALTIHLDTWLRDLRPLTSYVLQRATDTTLDGVCTGTNWLTLGKGATPQAITTNEDGIGAEALFRDVSAFPLGSTFDIRFRVLELASSAVVLSSECYQFTISQ
jgi:hypothetical protein